jgi:hypothetical protein
VAQFGQELGQLLRGVVVGEGHRGVPWVGGGLLGVF